MAGPSVMVSVFGDLKGLGDAFKGAGTAAQSAAGTAHEAFSGMLGALNATGVLGPFGDALDGIDKALETVAKHGKEIGPAMIGVGGALAGIGAGLSALGSKDQAAHQQLQQSVEATGKSYDDYAEQVDKAIKKQENFGHSAVDTQNALQILTQATGDPAKALQYLGTASDLAAARHESLGAAATRQLGNAYNGSRQAHEGFLGGSREKAVDTTGKMERRQLRRPQTAGRERQQSETASGRRAGLAERQDHPDGGRDDPAKRRPAESDRHRHHRQGRPSEAGRHHPDGGDQNPGGRVEHGHSGRQAERSGVGVGRHVLGQVGRHQNQARGSDGGHGPEVRAGHHRDRFRVGRAGRGLVGHLGRHGRRLVRRFPGR